MNAMSFLFDTTKKLATTIWYTIECCIRPSPLSQSQLAVVRSAAGEAKSSHAVTDTTADAGTDQRKDEAEEHNANYYSCNNSGSKAT